MSLENLSPRNQPVGPHQVVLEEEKGGPSFTSEVLNNLRYDMSVLYTLGRELYNDLGQIKSQHNPHTHHDSNNPRIIFFKTLGCLYRFAVRFSAKERPKEISDVAVALMGSLYQTLNVQPKQDPEDPFGNAERFYAKRASDISITECDNITNEIYNRIKQFECAFAKACKDTQNEGILTYKGLGSDQASNILELGDLHDTVFQDARYAIIYGKCVEEKVPGSANNPRQVVTANLPGAVKQEKTDVQGLPQSRSREKKDEKTKCCTIF